jgi:hypothetical protein
MKKENLRKRQWETQQIVKKPGDMLAQAADALTSGRVRKTGENQRKGEETEEKEDKEQEQENKNKNKNKNKQKANTKNTRKKKNQKEKNRNK